MAAKGKAQDEGQQPEGQAQGGGQATPADAQDAAANTAQGAGDAERAAEQGGADGAEQGGDGEPAHSRGGAKKPGASPKASEKASPKVTPATLAARQAQVFAAPALGAPMHEKHLGVVNRKGEPVDLAKVIIKDVPTGSTYRATETLYEETTIPGAESQTRRRILFGKDSLVPELELRELLRQVEERAKTNADEAAARDAAK